MSTPKSIRRHTPFNLNKLLVQDRVGQWSSGLFNPEHATRMAAYLSQFEHVESFMPTRLGQLMGLPANHDAAAAHYIYRTLRNPNIRLDVMKTLLQQAPFNKNKPDSWDYMLSEYGAVRSVRNDYAHGLWFTNDETGEVLLSKTDEHGFGFGFFAATKITTEEIDANLARLRKLAITVILPESEMPPLPRQDTSR